MACIKKTILGVQTALLPGEYSTEQECLDNCKMGACCLGLRCAVVPACACAKAGGHFFGPGTTCGRGTPENYYQLKNDIACCYQLRQGCTSGRPSKVSITITDTIGLKIDGQCVGNVSGLYLLDLQDDSSWAFIQDCGIYSGRCVASVPCMPPVNSFAQPGLVPFVATVTFSILNNWPVWSAVIQATDGFTPNGQGTFVTAHTGPPCGIRSDWAPAFGCYSGSANLYKYVRSSESCESRYELAGQITVAPA